MFNRDSLWFGVLIGILMPLFFYAFLYGGLWLYNSHAASPLIFDESLLQLASPAINLFFIRYYFVNKKYDETGRGLLLVTFVYIIAYFII
jgi:hypothetical protein